MMISVLECMNTTICHTSITQFFISILRVIVESSTTNTWYTGPCGSGDNDNGCFVWE